MRYKHDTDYLCEQADEAAREQGFEDAAAYEEWCWRGYEDLRRAVARDAYHYTPATLEDCTDEHS